MKATVIREFGAPEAMRHAGLRESVGRRRAGKIIAIHHRKMNLRQAAEAHHIVENNQVIGKIVLEPAKD